MSNTLVILWGQMEFWFQKKPNGFYKFLKPCNHRLFRRGDSWCEQLNISENTFRKYASKLCASYNSKRAFLSKSDPFQGKPYACYFDRLKKITFYFRNGSVANSLTREKIFAMDCVSVCVSSYTDNNRNKIYPPKSPLIKTQNRKVGRLDLKKGDKIEHRPVPGLPTKLHSIWIEETENQIKTPKLTEHFANKILQAFKTFFASSIERWRKYCRKIASSPFLMGKVGKFKAWLIWVLREDVIKKIREGAYGLTPEKEEFEDVPEDCSQIAIDCIKNQSKDAETEEILSSLKKKIGSPKYLSWFGKGTVIHRDKKILISNLTIFQISYIQENFQDVLDEIRITRGIGVLFERGRYSNTREF